MNDLMERFNDKTLGEFEYLKLNLLKIIKSKNVLQLNVSCPEKYGDTVNKNLNRITGIFEDILKVDFKVEVDCKTVVFDKELCVEDIYKFLDNYPLIKSNIEKQNICFTDSSDPLTCIIKTDKSTLDYCKGINLISILKRFVQDNYFCETEFILTADNDYNFDALDKNIKIESGRRTVLLGGTERKIKVTEKEKYIGSEINGDASYIEDIAIGEKVFCGTVSDISELKRKPKEGENPALIKPFYKFRLNDYTSAVDCIYFPTKASIGKMSEIKNGVSIIAYGNVEEDNYREKHGFIYKIRDISFCKLPSDFKPVIIKRVIPEEYCRVFPKPYFHPVQENLFVSSEEKVPSFLIGKTFCVFDTETTGLHPEVDVIIEIGAVLVENGKITQTFQSFINPHRPLSKKIIDLTSITDEDLATAPELEEVLSDFYKFSAKSALVGHNLKFDYDFISLSGKPFNIIFDNEQYDTLSLAQRFLTLRRNRLEDVAKYYSIVNEGAHRAIYDAITTAKIFIKLAEKL